jgi:hypothetical protein
MRDVLFFTALFSWLSLGLCGAAPAGADEMGARAVPTFRCVGLYWKPAGGGATVSCEVSYREAGARSAWRAALPLWFDPNDHEGLPEHSQEYRGSIAGLAPDTAYEIRLKLASTGQEVVLKTRTWSETFKIARTVTLPETLDATYEITSGGNPRDGYVLYVSPNGRRTVSDVQGQADVNLRVLAPYVIVRGVDLRGARFHGIELGRVTDVVIEDCDISGWGENLADGWGRDLDSAIYHRTPDGEPRTVKRIVIQNNRLHHPRSDSNCWLEARSLRKGSKHPAGPQGITLINADGEIVIRHNHIYSDFDHMFNDGMGEIHNFGYAGFPGRDSDVYGNFVSHCWDDALELEGANMNVRCWANVIDWTFMGIGGATTTLGPNYIFRNIYVHSRRGPESDVAAYKGQSFLKLGAGPRDQRLARGRIYVFHNTTLQPAAWGGQMDTSGAANGLHLTARDKRQTNIVSRNNAFWLRADRGTVVNDPQRSPQNDFDYDLSNNPADAVAASERHGIRAVPKFGRPIDPTLDWSVALEPGTPGHDQGVPIPNFNDDFAGKAADMGALEEGRPLGLDFPRIPAAVIHP